MDGTKVQESQTRINAMKYEHVLQDLLDRDDLIAARDARIADLEADHAIAMMWFRESLQALAKVTKERDQARRVNRELRELRKDQPSSIEPPSELASIETSRPTMRPYMVRHRATSARDAVQ